MKLRTGSPQLSGRIVTTTVHIEPVEKHRVTTTTSDQLTLRVGNKLRFKPVDLVAGSELSMAIGPPSEHWSEAKANRRVCVCVTAIRRLGHKQAIIDK